MTEQKPISTNDEEKKISLIPSVAFSNKKPYEAAKIRITEEIAENLLKAVMVEPPSEAQITMETLEMFSKNQIRQITKELIKKNPNFKFKATLPYEVEFTNDEDMCLLNYVRCYQPKKEKTVEEYFKQQSAIFRPCRTLKEVKQRVNEISKMSDEEKQEIIEKQVNQIITEDLYFQSTEPTTDEQKTYGLSAESFVTSRCFYEPYHQPPIRNSRVPLQIEQCEKTLPIVTDKYFNNRCLAILRTENTVYYMKREAITFGRESIDYDVDVDLSFENEKTCIHTSRVQAILSFLDDLNFYLENIGNRGFRVNGELIPPGDICKVNDGDIFDFSGVLLLFIINKRLVENIRQKLDAETPLLTAKTEAQLPSTDSY